MNKPWPSYPQTAEHKLIEKIKDWTGEGSIGDDCAILPGQILISSDTLVEGKHFLLSISTPASLGWKAVAAALSDIAAMGGKPRQLLVNLSLPPYLSGRQIEQLYLSMVDCALTYRTKIVGGDLTGSPVLVVTVTVLGEAHEAGLIMRCQARSGYVVAVTGSFGASAAGFCALVNDLPGWGQLKQRHLCPTPRLSQGWWLVSKTGSRAALMDASDGLADALVQIARASGTGMAIDDKAVPIDDETRSLAKQAGINPLEWALYGGEDYELVAAIPKDVWQRWQDSPDNPFLAIGQVTSSPVVQVGGKEVDLERCFQHFSWLA